MYAFTFKLTDIVYSPISYEILKINQTKFRPESYLSCDHIKNVNNFTQIRDLLK